MKIKTILLFLALCVTMGVSAQMRYHDVEYHEAKGKVKSISTNFVVGGEPKLVTVEFTVDGKQIGVTDAEYDSNGYRIKSTDKIINDITTTSNYVWENGRFVKLITLVNGMSLTCEYTYNAKGEVVEVSAYNMGSAKNTVKFQLSDYKYDSRGNWISRKNSGMGTPVTETRTIVYY